eukprot:PRCOL_00003287-RA
MFTRGTAGRRGERVRAAVAIAAIRKRHPSVPLLAVANPSTLDVDGGSPFEGPPQDPPERAHDKVDAGASCIITQPALARGPFDAWWERASAAQETALTSRAAVVVGLPFLKSAGAHAFWLKLLGLEADGTWRGPEPTREEEEVGQAAAATLTAPTEDAALWLARTVALHRHALALPDVAGTHAMPATSGGWAAHAALEEVGWVQ